MAWSGQASTLRHRFWGTVAGQCDHTGMRYVGVLLYDAAGQECPLELRLGADELGRVEPARHDNRVHLIVLNQPVLFCGEMEVFQLTAPATETFLRQFALGQANFASRFGIRPHVACGGGFVRSQRGSAGNPGCSGHGGVLVQPPRAKPGADRQDRVLVGRAGRGVASWLTVCRPAVDMAASATKCLAGWTDLWNRHANRI